MTTTLALAIDSSAAQRGAKDFADSIEKVRAAGAKATASVDALGTGFGKLPPQISKTSSALSGFVAGLTAMAAAQAVSFLGSLAGQVISVGDAAERTAARIRLFTEGMAGAGSAQADLFNIAQSSSQGLQGVSDLFIRLAQNATFVLLDGEHSSHLSSDFLCRFLSYEVELCSSYL